jgi:Ran-binding protein 1
LTNAASAAASTVTSAASGVADNVFSMFGGGVKKEKKGEDEDRGDVSGSAKAQKAAAAEENPEVYGATFEVARQKLTYLCVG